MRRILFAALTATAWAAVASEGVAWTNLDAEHRIGGRMASEGYMCGKVVLVCRWGCSSETSCGYLSRMEEYWKNYKYKPFVLLGSHLGECGSTNEANAVVAKKGLSFPVYADAGLSGFEPKAKEIPSLYLVDETGSVHYEGTDEHEAVERLVTTLTDMESPKDVEAWERFVDFETKTLPGRGFMRLEAFRKKFPQEAKKYEADYKRLKADAEVQKLVPLVRFAKQATDFDPKNKKTKNAVNRVKIEHAIQKYAPLKKSKNGLVAQEAKNALADLKWALSKFDI